MTTFTATFRIVTPMFLAGAEQSTAELRAASIKGALRFWWRALQWNHYQNVAKLHEKEAELFGSSESGQSKVRIRIVKGTNRKPMPVGNILRRDGSGYLQPGGSGTEGNEVGEGARYLSYGVMEAFSGKNTTAGKLTRSCFPCPIEDFQVEFCVKEQTSVETVQQAIIAVGTFGGLGSKSRKGYGSMNLIQLQRDTENIPLEHPKEFIDSIVRSTMIKSLGLPEWTAFSQQSQFVILNGHEKESPLELLNRVGRDQVFYRSWGKNGKVFGQNAEQRFSEDHVLMDDVINKGNAPKAHPVRVGFGLPHNYFFSSTKQKGDVEPKKHGRRASPLFLHIHQPTKSAVPQAILVLLPSKFLPEGEKISVGKSHGKMTTVDCLPEAELYEPIRNWMQSLVTGQRTGTNKKTERFNEPVAIPPFTPPPSRP